MRRHTRKWPAVVVLVILGAVAGVIVTLDPATPDRPAALRRPIAVTDGPLTLPLAPGSIRFAIIGDAGRGDDLQYETAAQMARWHERFPFEFVLMLGDNIYGPGTPEDLALRFDRPYQALLDHGVTFHAAVGNHDPLSILSHPPLGMDGHRYYSFLKSGGAPLRRTSAEFFAIDTVSLDDDELAWLRHALEGSTADWKIAFYHHPLYTSGEYRLTALRTRWRLESIFVAGGVDVGFSGHEHFYERVIPQRGVQYFTSGAGGALRRGDIRPSGILAAGFDDDTHFMLVEIASDVMHFQVIKRTGQTVDYGDVPLDPKARTPPSLRP